MTERKKQSGMKKNLKIGTRASQLALTQTDMVLSALKKIDSGLSFEIKTYKTHGDKDLKTPLSMIDHKAIFTKELEEALLKKEIDVAVHSAKDLYSDLAKGLVLGAVPEREMAADIFIAHGPARLKDLPSDARIGTSSVRRRAQLRLINPSWQIADLRGNVDTRLRKLEEGFYEGIVIALAGIKRLGLLDEWPNREVLSEKEFLPAPCQGALALEIREEDKEIREVLRTINHPASELRVRAEREYLRVLQGGCQIPIGVSSSIQDGQITLIGALFSLDGSEAIRWSTHGDKDKPEVVGAHLAEWLLNAGGKELLETIKQRTSH